MIILKRCPERDGATFGVFYNEAGHDVCVSMELPWKENARSVSCIPAGEYPLTREDHPRFGECFRLAGVPDRDGVLIHAANVPGQIRGCIAPGMEYGILHLPGDGPDGSAGVLRSREALALLLAINPKSIKIINPPMEANA